MGTVCKRCVMDTSDPLIHFDDKGYCNHCSNFLSKAPRCWFPNDTGRDMLLAKIKDIKKAGKGKDYDCLIGLSGGVDSSYLAYKMKEYDLRALVFHVDAGWNSELAQKNIENICKQLGYDLYTHVVDWEEMKDLQLAFLRAAVANQDVPQDHIFFAVLFKTAAARNISYWISGSNYATESILPSAWGYTAMDSRLLFSIHRRFGSRPLKTYVTLSFTEYCRYYLGYPSLDPVQSFAPLNLMAYNVIEAKKELAERIGWRDYGKKHYESRFTKFFQGHYLPTKFGYDKRRAHLSSLIISGTLTRDEALAELAKPLYPPEELREDKAFILKKLGLTPEEWEQLMALPNRSFADYPNYEQWFKWALRLKGVPRRLASCPSSLYALAGRILGKKFF